MIDVGKDKVAERDVRLIATVAATPGVRRRMGSDTWRLCAPIWGSHIVLERIRKGGFSYR